MIVSIIIIVSFWMLFVQWVKKPFCEKVQWVDVPGRMIWGTIRKEQTFYNNVPVEWFIGDHISCTMENIWHAFGAIGGHSYQITGIYNRYTNEITGIRPYVESYKFDKKIFYQVTGIKI